MPRAGDRCEPRFTAIAVFPALLEPAFPRGAVLGNRPGAHITPPRSVPEHCGAGRGGLCAKHGHCGRVGCGLGVEREHCDAGKSGLQAVV